MGASSDLLDALICFAASIAYSRTTCRNTLPCGVTSRTAYTPAGALAAPREKLGLPHAPDTNPHWIPKPLGSDDPTHSS